MIKEFDIVKTTRIVIKVSTGAILQAGAEAMVIEIRNDGSVLIEAFNASRKQPLEIFETTLNDIEPY
jgi:hypothetical protein